MPEVIRPPAQEQGVPQEQAPVPAQEVHESVQQPAAQIPGEKMLHKTWWSKFINGIKGIGQSADQLLQLPSLLPIYLASGVWGILASCGRLITFHKPKFKQDFTRATNFLPEWPRRIVGVGLYAWALLAL